MSDHGILAKMCQLSYRLAGIPGAIEDVTARGRHGPRAFVFHEGEKAVVVFRGTNDPEGWLEDFDVLKVSMGQARVHEGFLDYWRFVRPRVLAACGNRPCVLTGHSLGGAVATLAAAEGALDVEEVVTFGAPRVGNAGFAAGYRLAGRTTRYVHLFDPVPWVPSWLWGYRHVSPATWYDGTHWRPYATVPYLLGLCQRTFSVKTPCEVAGAIRRLRDYHQVGHYARAFSSRQGVLP